MRAQHVGVANALAEAEARAATAQEVLHEQVLAASFASFVCDTPAQVAALDACKSFADELNPAGGGGLWLIGPPGTGKTHLGSSMVQHVLIHFQSWAISGRSHFEI